MSVRSVNATYTVRETTNMAGFLPTAKWLGMDSSWSAPGAAFILGDQDPDIRFKAAENDWLTRSSVLTAPFRQTLSRDMSFRAAVEPNSDIKIQLDAKRTSTGGYQEIYRFDSISNDYQSLTPSRNGRYEISYISIGTAFEKQVDNNSLAYENFVKNVDVIYDRINQELFSSGISDTYDTISQDVLIPAFLAAYSKNDPYEVPLKPFPTIPLPNWRVDYAGLTKIPSLAAIFSSINLTHAYTSTFNIQNYTNSLVYKDNMTLDNDLIDYPFGSVVDSSSGNLIPVYIINQVSVLEQFSPLLGINIRTKKNLNARVDFKRSRSLSLNLSNAQVTETTNEDVAFDFGYTKADLKLPFRVRGRVITIENDVTFRVNMTIRDTKSVQRKLDGENTLTNGNKTFLVRPTVGYKLNQNMDLTMYFEKNITNPTLGSYKRSATSFGIQLRFSLTQ
jgi:cell surface protein SprA